MYEKIQTPGADMDNLWERGSPDGWYAHSKSSSVKTFRRWWPRSLVAHIGFELFCYMIVYYIIHIIYKEALTKEQQDEFAAVVVYFSANLSPVGRDLAFLLGFYVKQIVSRWWDQYRTLPWPDKLPLLTHALVNYPTQKSALFSKTINRYAMLSYILCLRRISKALKVMFPSNQSLTDAKLATEKEISIIESEGDLGRVWWIPLSWAMTLVRKSKEEETVSSDQKILIAALMEFQTNLEKVDTYDHIVFPPVYKQVVNFAIYIYFGLSLIGEQELKDTPELLPYFPSFLVLKFIFFFGWKEVANAINNPFGDDEDDFQICHLVSRHIWAIGTNIKQFPGPPAETTEDDDHDEETEVRIEHVAVDVETHKKAEGETNA